MRIPGGLPFYLLFLCVKGPASIAGQQCGAGTAWMVPAESAEVEVNGGGSEWILAYTAEQPIAAFNG